MEKLVVITGASQGIGLCIKQCFLEKGYTVCDMDLQSGAYFQGDVGDKESLELFANNIIAKYGKVDYLINNAPPINIGIDSCSYGDFQRALNIGLTSAFYLTKLFKPYFAKGASIVNISSTRAFMSMTQTESYTAAKAGLLGLNHALAISLAGKVRVNAISPGWIETDNANWQGADALQQPVGRVGKPEDIAKLVLFLCSDEAGFITCQNIVVDGGMSKQMIYHGENGWKLEI